MTNQSVTKNDILLKAAADRYKAVRRQVLTKTNDGLNIAAAMQDFSTISESMLCLKGHTDTCH